MFGEFKSAAFANQGSLVIDTLDIIVEELELDIDKLNDCLASGRPSAHLNMIEGLAKVLNVQQVPTFFLDNAQIQTPRSLAAWESLLQL